MSATREGTYTATKTDDSVSLTLYPEDIHTIPEDATYVAPDGDDEAGDGSEEKPYGTLPKLNGLLEPGATVLMRGGTYDVNTPAGWFWTSSGTAEAPIRIWAYPGEQPIIDLTNCTATKSKYFGATHAGGNGVQCSNVSYTHWRGIHVRKAPMEGMCFYGDKEPGCVGNIIEQCSFSENGRFGEVGHGLTCYWLGHAYQIINCDSYLNKNSVGNGNNADGFLLSTVGADDNIISGCRAWQNGDDGFDTFNPWHLDTVQGAWSFESCWAFQNGYAADNVTETGGDGNGFKLGGSHEDSSNGPHTVRNCLSWSQKVNGFEDNDTDAIVTLYNNTAWNNNRTNKSPAYYGNFYFEAINAKPVLKNNLSAMPAFGKISRMGAVDAECNSWDLAIEVTAADFLSLDDTAAIGLRQADGSLPISDFLRLAPASRCIDKGMDVGIAFNGAAPDLGAYETEPAAV